MLLTKQKNRKQIDSLKMDLEIINPIESKKVLGGDWYYELDNVNIYGDERWSYGYGNDEGGMTIVYGGGGSSNQDYGGWWDSNLGGNYNDHGSWGGGNTGGGPDGSSDPTFPDHICTQADYSSTCATMALSYVANYFGATGLTSSDFAEMVGNDYLSMLTGQPNPITDIFSDGLTGAQISTIMSSVFQSTIIDGSTASMESNLNSGNPILATIDLGGGNGHEVVIVGFNASLGTVSYMDSMVGGLVTSNLNAVTFTSQLYAVTGVQNNATVNQYKNDTNDIKCSICGH
jgi:hypothetical protein